MYKLITTSFLLLFSFNYFSQEGKIEQEKTQYISINLPPLLGNTIELGYEKNKNLNWSFDVYGGYTFDSKLNGLCTKEYTGLEIQEKSGGFLKIGARYYWRKKIKILSPFIGVSLVNSISVEKATQQTGRFENGLPTLYIEDIISKKYNLGISAVIGITIKATSRFNFDLGIQAGGLIVNNLVDCNSYMPGMGAEGLLGKTQGVLRLKYRIN
ncbi:MAG: hypothetical protein ABF242_02945 [Flavobacteriales bacterium]